MEKKSCWYLHQIGKLLADQKDCDHKSDGVKSPTHELCMTWWSLMLTRTDKHTDTHTHIRQETKCLTCWQATSPKVFPGPSAGYIHLHDQCPGRTHKQDTRTRMSHPTQANFMLWHTHFLTAFQSCHLTLQAPLIHKTKV